MTAIETENSDPWFLNIPKVINNNELPSFIRKAAILINRHEYFNASTYFSSIDDEELLQMQLMFSEQDNPEAMEILCLLTILFFQGEGAFELESDKISDGMQSLTLLTNLVKLQREGIVELFLDNFTLLDKGDLPLARKI